MGGWRGSGEYGPMHEYMEKALAQALGMSEEELEAALEDGKTMWQVAEEKGLTAEKFQDVMLTARQEAIEKMVADGVLPVPMMDGGTPKMEDGAETMADGAEVAEAVTYLVTYELNGKSKEKPFADKAKAETFTITERVPAIDVGTTTVGVILTTDVLDNLPLGRTYDEVLMLTPGYLNGGFSGGGAFRAFRTSARYSSSVMTTPSGFPAVSSRNSL